ncbi:MFS transporter [Limnochorda pilosa]|nr:MFS transporter [Limnochorda pilosa]
MHPTEASPPREAQEGQGPSARQARSLNPWALAALCSVPFVMVLGNSMLIPVFPLIERTLGITSFQVGLLVTAFSVPAGLLIPVAGALSDRYGRKVVMVPALVLYGTGGLLAGLSAVLADEPFALILGARVLQGVGAGGTYQLAMTLAGDLLPGGRRAKALGLLETSNGAGKVVSPLLGSLLAVVAWFAPFFFYGALTLPAALAVWWLVPEGPPRGQPVRRYFQGLKQVYREKGASLAGAYATGAVSLFLLFGALAAFSDQLEAVYRVKDLWKGLALAVPVTAMALLSYVTGRLLQGRPGRVQPAIVLGLGTTALALAALPLLQSLTWRLVDLMVLGVGVGSSLTPVNTAVTGAVDAARRGAVTCLYGSMRFFGVAAGPPAFGLAAGAGWGPWALYLTAAGLAAATAAAVALGFRPGRLVLGPGKGPAES